MIRFKSIVAKSLADMLKSIQLDGYYLMCLAMLEEMEVGNYFLILQDVFA
jgi:hypothetical protein